MRELSVSSESRPSLIARRATTTKYSRSARHACQTQTNSFRAFFNWIFMDLLHLHSALALLYNYFWESADCRSEFILIKSGSGSKPPKKQEYNFLKYSPYHWRIGQYQVQPNFVSYHYFMIKTVEKDKIINDNSITYFNFFLNKKNNKKLLK